MKISARNQLAARITGIEKGKVNGNVSLQLPVGCDISATISMKAIELMNLAPDKTVYAVVKATDFIIARRPPKSTVWHYTHRFLSGVGEGAVNGMVFLDIGRGQQISSTISMEAIRELGLKKGMEAFAVFKSTSVMIGLELDHISFGLM